MLTMFLLPDINIRLRPEILAMRPGTRVVSNSFTMGDWTPDKTVQIGGNCRSYCKAYLWVVPANVAGTWQLPQGELVLEQKYQMISGTLRSGNVITPVKGRVSGDQITFTVRGTKQKGQVNGNVMEGTSGLGHSKASWRAQRV